MTDALHQGLMRRIVVLFAAVLTLVSCHSTVDPNTVAPNEAGADRSYTLVGCGTGATLPCQYHFAASHDYVADSGRLALRRDHTASWMLASRVTQRPCYLGPDTCPAIVTTTIDTFATTYRFSGDTLYLTHSPTYIMLFTPTALVPATWLGPDSLSYSPLGGQLRYKP